MKLPLSDAEILADFYETPYWTAFKKHFLDAKEAQIIKNLLEAKSMEDIQWAKGAVNHIDYVRLEMKRAHKAVLDTKAQKAA